ncbi:hypothetical protein PV326_009127 [Microctonus aethiopoides]|nr:hypothetical protein PV326_009127 [Microctonus aethiopoides]
MAMRMQQHPGTSIKKSKTQKKRNIIPLREMFEAYIIWDPVSEVMDIDAISFSQLNRWLISAQVVDMSRVTTTDAFLCFFQFRKRAIEFDEFLLFLEDLADTKDLCLKTMKYQLQTCGKPPPPPDLDSDE